MTDYTPGEWYEDNLDIWSDFVNSAGKKQHRHIASVSYQHEGNGKNHNAELIASAPRIKQERDDLARIFSAVIDLGIIDCDAPSHQSKQLVLLLEHAAELIEGIDHG